METTAIVSSRKKIMPSFSFERKNSRLWILRENTVVSFKRKCCRLWIFKRKYRRQLQNEMLSSAFEGEYCRRLLLKEKIAVFGFLEKIPSSDFKRKMLSSAFEGKILPSSSFKRKNSAVFGSRKGMLSSSSFLVSSYLFF